MGIRRLFILVTVNVTIEALFYISSDSCKVNGLFFTLKSWSPKKNLFFAIEQTEPGRERSAGRTSGNRVIPNELRNELGNWDLIEMTIPDGPPQPEATLLAHASRIGSFEEDEKGEADGEA